MRNRNKQVMRNRMPRYNIYFEEYYLLGYNADVSAEHIASIFRVEYAEQDTSVKAGGKLAMFLRNVG
jgi:hypothetical protein